MSSLEYFDDIPVIVQPSKIKVTPAEKAAIKKPASSKKKAESRGFKTRETASLSDKVLSIRKAVKTVVTKFGEDIESVAAASNAKSIELAFSVSLSVEKDFIILGVKGEGTVSVTMTWEKKP